MGDERFPFTLRSTVLEEKRNEKLKNATVSDDGGRSF